MDTKATFESNYEHLTNEQLMRIAADREELVEEAVAALDSEMQKRGLRQGQAKRFKEHLKRIDAIVTVGRLGLNFRGFGKLLLGAFNYVADELNGMEEFDSTLWGFVLFLPIFPLSTVRIRRKLKGKSFFWSFRKADFTPKQVGGINLGQVAITYAGVAVTICLAFSTLIIVLEALH